MIPVNTPLLAGNEKKYLIECIDTGWISSEGPFIQKFENEFSTYVDRDHGIAVANGSAALDIAVKAIGITTGDEVILPSFTIISPAYSIIKQGATPVLIDADPVTWSMDISKIEEKITSKTKAIIAVHIYGFPVNMNPLLEIAKKYNLKVIEDAAEMHGQTYYGKKCGSFGDISIFSFYPNKHITTGEGGMIVTNNENLAERCKELRNLCFKPEKRFVHDDIGWNYRMTNMQAAIGVAQLEQINDFIDKKRKMGSLYTQLLYDIEQIDLMPTHTSYADNIYWIFGILLNKKSQYKVNEVTSALALKNIGTRPFFYPIHQQPIFNKMGLFKNERYPVAEHLSENGFYIPSGLGLSEEEIRTVAIELKNIFQK